MLSYGLPGTTHTPSKPATSPGCVTEVLCSQYTSIGSPGLALTKSMMLGMRAWACTSSERSPTKAKRGGRAMSAKAGRTVQGRRVQGRRVRGSKVRGSKVRCRH